MVVTVVCGVVQRSKTDALLALGTSASSGSCRSTGSPACRSCRKPMLIFWLPHCGSLATLAWKGSSARVPTSTGPAWRGLMGTGRVIQVATLQEQPRGIRLAGRQLVAWHFHQKGVGFRAGGQWHAALGDHRAVGGGHIHALPPPHCPALCPWLPGAPLTTSSGVTNAGRGGCGCATGGAMAAAATGAAGVAAAGRRLRKRRQDSTACQQHPGRQGEGHAGKA